MLALTASNGEVVFILNIGHYCPRDQKVNFNFVQILKHHFFIMCVMSYIIISIK